MLSQTGRGSCGPEEKGGRFGNSVDGAVGDTEPQGVNRVCVWGPSEWGTA